jgi:hypothetical protein
MVESINILIVPLLCLCNRATAIVIQQTITAGNVLKVMMSVAVILPGSQRGCTKWLPICFILGANELNPLVTPFRYILKCSMCTACARESRVWTTTSEKDPNATADRKALKNNSLHFRYQCHLVLEQYACLLRCKVFKSRQIVVITIVNKSSRHIRASIRSIGYGSRCSG